MSHISVALLCILITGILSAAPPKGQDNKKVEVKFHPAQHALAVDLPGVYTILPRFLHQYLRPPRTTEVKYWVVIFFTRWCVVCDDFATPYADVAKAMLQHKKRIHFGKVDVTEDEGAAHRFGIDSYPSIVVFDAAVNNAVVLSTFEGPRTAEALTAWIVGTTGLEPSRN